jgi:hypothetical protein
MFQPCKAWYLYLMLVLMMTLAPVVELILDFCHIARSNFPLVVDTTNAAAATTTNINGGRR